MRNINDYKSKSSDRLHEIFKEQSKNKERIDNIRENKKEGEWKIQLIVEINFISLKPGSDETRVMYTRSDNEEFMNGDDTNEIIKLLSESFLQRFEENLQEKMKRSDFEFDGSNFFYYNFNKTNI